MSICAIHVVKHGMHEISVDRLQFLRTAGNEVIPELTAGRSSVWLETAPLIALQGEHSHSECHRNVTWLRQLSSPGY